jgi:nicotinamidase-related amidase
MPRLHRAETFLLVVDFQEKLMPVIDGAGEITRNIDRLVRGAHILDMPAVLTEQYPKGLGATVPEIRRAFEETAEYQPIEKATFSAYGCAEFVTALRHLHRKHVLIAGVETHVCVYQTAIDLLANGLDVTIVADAVSSRTPANKRIALQRLQAEGARLSSTEMALFELTVVSGTEEFREISRLIK